MSAHDDDGVGRQAADLAAHFAHLAEVRNDSGNPNDVVIGGGQFALEIFESREIE